MPNYDGVWGGLLDKDIFYDCVYRCCTGELTMKKAAVICGVSGPTFSKWANKLVRGEEISERIYRVKNDGIDSTD